MTNTQLLLLAINNITNNTELSHSQESYVYQYYHTHIASQYPNLNEFMAVFMQSTSDTINNDDLVTIPCEQIYMTIERYLNIAEKRYVERQKLLQK